MAGDTTSGRGSNDKTRTPSQAPGREDSIRPNVAQTDGGSRFQNPTKDSVGSSKDTQKTSKTPSGSKNC